MVFGIMFGARVKNEKASKRTSNGALRCVPLAIQSSVKELESKDKLLQEITEVDKVQLMGKEKRIIPLNMWDKVLIEVVEEKAKLESLHLMKGLNYCLYPLKRMFPSRIVKRTSIRARFG